MKRGTAAVRHIPSIACAAQRGAGACAAGPVQAALLTRHRPPPAATLQGKQEKRSVISTVALKFNMVGREAEARRMMMDQRSPCAASGRRADRRRAGGHVCLWPGGA